MKSFDTAARRYARQVRRAARSQRGSAIIVAVMVMALLALFVAASLSRVTNEALIMSNDYASTESYFAAQAGLEHMTRDFSDIFDVKISPSSSDLDDLEADGVPGYDEFEINKQITQDGSAVATTIEPGNDFSGLVALRTSYRLTSTATGPTDAQVRLTRTLNNYTIPIFQFGIFYDDPMEIHPGPKFNFGGRVHTNGDLYLAADSGLTFRDRVTAVGEVVVDVARSGKKRSDKWGLEVFVNDGLERSDSLKKVEQGSVANGPDTPERQAKRRNPSTGALGYDDPNEPNGTKNGEWTSFSRRFRDNLKPGVDPLKLPLQLDNRAPIEIVRRGEPGDSQVTASSRYCNKTGLRISLGDTQAKLPGGTGGVRLDGAASGDGSDAPAGQPRGYRPEQRPDGTRATRVNGHRLARASNRQVWIKVEAVKLDPSTLEPTTTDITKEILSLGVTDRSTIYGTAVGDPDAIIKLQRFAMAGPPLMSKSADFFKTDSSALDAHYSTKLDSSAKFRNAYTYVAGADYKSSYSFVSGTDNVLVDYTRETNGYPTVSIPDKGAYSPSSSLPLPRSGAHTATVVPFPIMLFDVREGLYNDSLDQAQWKSTYHSGNDTLVPVRGIMSVVDFDVASFKRLVEGSFDGKIYNGLKGSDIPKLDGEGWVVYVSDRRGDLDDDGEYDMENVLVATAGESSTAASAFNRYVEDANHNGAFDASYASGFSGSGWLGAPTTVDGEAVPFNIAVPSDQAALVDTPFYRRAARLVNGQTLPGTPNDDPSTSADEIEGFSFASENGVYILGNYNATGVSEKKEPTAYDKYQGTYVPSSVVSDAVSILSRDWLDAKSFRYPFEFGSASHGGRVVANETTVRTALLMGDTISGQRYKVVNGSFVEMTETGPTGGGGDVFLAGGVHNFKRFLENWDGKYLNYCGSLINLFNSVNNSGPFKCCTHVYSPPTRNWVFDATFLDPMRLPPGTPFFQYINVTGFRRIYAQPADE